MADNLFQQAKEMIEDFFNDGTPHEGHTHGAHDKEAMRQAINAAYNEASPKEQEELRQFEQKLDEEMGLDEQTLE